MSTHGGGLRKRRRPDPSLPLDTVNDTRLSFRGLGVLLWLESKPDGWSVRSDQMAKDGKRADGTGPNGQDHNREGREAIRTTLLDILAPAGYYRLERRRMRDGSIEMGTAVSTDSVESWARQRELFGRRPVPMIEQKDGTFLVMYPDGSTGPDDCDPPEMGDHSHVGDTDDDDDDPAGQGLFGDDVSTGAQKPVPGSPAPRNPAPGDPATGEPATGNTSPLKEEELLREVPSKETPPTPAGRSAAEPVVVQERGGDFEKRPNLDSCVDWFVGARPDWKAPAIRAALVAAYTSGVGDLGECATALRELAEGVHGETTYPGRLNVSPAPWWDAVAARRVAAEEARRRRGPRCGVHGHFLQPAKACRLCVAERNSEAAVVEERPAGDAPVTGIGMRVLKRRGLLPDGAVVSG